MEEIIHRCPVCKKIVALEKNRREQRIEKVNGITWDQFGYSLGGWGNRKNFMEAFSGEICSECFNIIKIKIDVLIQTIKERKDSCDEGICIYRTSANETKGDQVSIVQKNEL